MASHYGILQCVNGWAGDGFICAADPDQDGIPTETQDCSEYTCRRDNCPNIPNSGQEDNDQDWIGSLLFCRDGGYDSCRELSETDKCLRFTGDVCDDDDDNDGIVDLSDNCQYHYNRVQSDDDADLIGECLCAVHNLTGRSSIHYLRQAMNATTVHQHPTPIS